MNQQPSLLPALSPTNRPPLSAFREFRAGLMAGLAAMAIAATTRSVLWTLAGGFVVLGVWS